MAAPFAAAGLPRGYHAAGAVISGRLSDLRDRDDVGVDDVIDRLTRD
jgi:hypothetical protein